MATTGSDSVTIGDIVRAIRKQRRLRTRETAKKAGVNHGTLLRVESGRPARAETLRKIERALDITEGSLTYCALEPPGAFFLQDLGTDYVFVRPNPSCTKKIPIWSQRHLRSPNERQRIGLLGFVSAFQYRICDIGLMGSAMASSLLELYAETAPSQHSGEELVFGLQGISVIKIGGEELTVHPGQTAKFWPTHPHTYAPSTSCKSSVLLSVRIGAIKGIAVGPTNRS
jgi:transcriptional regulator with XRE-family HTH domain